MKKLFTLAILAIFAVSCTVTQPISATSNPIGSKIGRAGGTCFFGICLDVDASILTAAKNGGITRVSTVDYRTKNYLGLIKKYECIVTGE